MSIKNSHPPPQNQRMRWRSLAMLKDKKMENSWRNQENIPL